ncbi:hypothetical protein QYM36_005208, partial [Artemia franciscana]
ILVADAHKGSPISISTITKSHKINPGALDQRGVLAVNARLDNPYCQFEKRSATGPTFLSCLMDFPSNFQPENIYNLGIFNATLGIITHDKYIDSPLLSNLSISGCGITDIQETLFMTTPNLELSDLSGNRLVVIRVSTFYGIEKLKFLNLAHNEIALIEPGSFWSLTTLQVPDLSQNHLTEFPAHLPSSLTELKMPSNNIQQITTPVSLPTATSLDLCSNKLGKIGILRGPNLRSLCLGVENLKWDNIELKSSSLDKLESISFLKENQGDFPANVLNYIQEKLIHKLTITNAFIARLILPPTLTSLSLLNVKGVNDIESLKSCAPNLQRLYLTGSSALVELLATNIQIVQKMNNLKQLIIRESNLNSIDWIDQQVHTEIFPMLTECDISDSMINCSNGSNLNTLCSSIAEDETIGIRFIGMNAIKCAPSGEAWSQQLCSTTSELAHNPVKPQLMNPPSLPPKKESVNQPYSVTHLEHRLKQLFSIIGLLL